MNEKKRIGILFGGKSAEHEVSLQSAKNIYEAIDKTKYDVVLIGIDRDGKWYLNNAQSLLKDVNPDLIKLNIDIDPSTLIPDELLEPVLEFEREVTTEYIEKRVVIDLCQQVSYGVTGRLEVQGGDGRHKIRPQV